MPPSNRTASQRPEDVIQRSKRNQIPGILQFPADLGAHSMLMIFNDYVYQRPGTRELNKVGASTFTARNLAGKTAILLPLPANIEDSYSIRVQGFEADISGEQVSASAASLARSSIGNNQDISVGELASILGNALPDIDWNNIFSTNMRDISRNIAFLGRRSLEKVLPGASRNVDVGLGNTLNPKASLYFDGVNLKQPTFSWTLAPTEESESETIKTITDTIKQKSLPTYGSGVGLQRAILNYPSTVDIFFFGIQQEYFVFYKTCMVQQFTVNYTPSGLAFVKGGKPAIINMTMGLMEMDIHTAEDYGGSSTWVQNQNTNDINNILTARQNGANIGF